MTVASLPLVEPDVQISRIRLSPESSFPQGMHGSAAWPCDPASISPLAVVSVMEPLARFNPLPASLTRLDSGQGSFAPRALPRFLTTTSLSDSRTRPLRRLWLPTKGCPLVAKETPKRASQVPDASFHTRRLLSPRKVQPLRLIEASGLLLASPLLKGWPLSISFNGAEPSSRDATARVFASTGSARRGCPHRPPH
jgi:hypothetical protein